MLVQLCAAMVLCGDALQSLGRRVVGADGTETWVFLWGHAWTRHALLEEGRFPYETTWVNFPDGGLLWLKDPLGTVSMLPLQLLAGIPVAATAWTVLLFTLAGVCAMALTRRLGAGWLGATLAGLLYMAHPHALGEAVNANVEALAHFVLPLWLGALIAVLRVPRVGRVVAAAAALWLLLVGNQYWAVAMIPVSLVVLLVEVPRAPRPARSLGAAAAAVVTGAACFAPVGRAIWSSMHSQRPLNELPLDDTIELVPPYLVDAFHLFSARASLGGPSLPFLDLVYPGWLALGLALAAPVLARRRGLLLLGVGALGFLLLSLGPALSWRGDLVLHDGRPVMLPWSWLTSLPLLSGMTLPSRMAVPAALAVAVGAGLSLSVLAGWRPGGRPSGPAVALLIGGLAVGEMVHAAGLGLPLPTVPVPAPAHAFVLRDTQAPGAVLDLPLNRGSNQERVALWHQAIHRRPIQASLRFQRPALARRQPLVDLFWALDRPGADAAALADAAVADDPLDPRGLVAEGFGFIVLHDAALRSLGRPADAFTEVLEHCCGPGMAMPDGQSTVWPLTDEGRVAAEQALQALESGG